MSNQHTHSSRLTDQQATRNAKLQALLAAWSGRETAALADFFTQYCTDDDFSDWLLAELAQVTDIVNFGLLNNQPQAATKAKPQRALTWLLLQHCRHSVSEQTLSKVAIARWCDIAVHLQDWQALLHWLQSLPMLQLQDSQWQPLYPLIRHGISHPQKFVRAWAYQGFYLLARALPQYQPEFNHCYRLAMQDEAPSVKARLRALSVV